MLSADNRETRVIKELQLLDVPFSIKTMEVGDFEIENRLIIERKTISDLASSIKDGRYDDQKLRLLSQPLKVVYIFEGQLNFTDSEDVQGVSHNALVSVLLLSQLRDNIAVIKTRDLKETALAVRDLMDRSDRWQECKVFRTPLVKSKRSSNFNDQDVFRSMLSQVPGLGPTKASIVAEMYPNMSMITLDIDLESNLASKIGKKTAKTLVRCLKGA
jgi:ERCC4-type nuclease